MRYITEDEVNRFLTMEDVVEILEEAFLDLADGKSGYSMRGRLPLGSGSLITMPGYLGRHNVAGMKTYVGGQKANRHVVILDSVTGELVAVIESSRMGQLKTGALPAMVTRRIAGGRNQSLCIIGSGFQAVSQLEGMLSQFNLEGISVYSRNLSHAEDFAERMSGRFGVDIRAFGSVSRAMEGATIVSSITSAASPVFSRQDLGDAWHLNLCGANVPSRVEASEDVLAGSQLVIVEDMEQAMAESSEILALRKNHPEVPCISLGKFMEKPARSAVLERTVFKSMGVGLEDVAAAYALLRNMGIL